MEKGKNEGLFRKRKDEILGKMADKKKITVTESVGWTGQCWALGEEIINQPMAVEVR